MNEILVKLGWVHFYTCDTCKKQKHYSNSLFEGYIVKIRDNKQTFLIEYNNRNICGPWMAGLLELKLQEQKIYAAI